MMKPSELYVLLGEVSGAFGAPFFDSYREARTATGLEGPEWGTLAVAHDYWPECVSAARLQVRTPYTNPQTAFEAQFVALAQKGMLEPVGSGEYQITPAGHEIVNRLNAALADAMRALDPLPTREIERIAALLLKLIASMTATPEPEIPAFLTNRRSDQGPRSPVMLRILQYMADFNAFRDDVHLAAWRPLGVSGPAWEAFTFVWRGDARTPAELAEKLDFRNWTADDYAAALGELVKKGWVAEKDGAYQVTDAGQKVRQDVEDQTERYYALPFAAFSAAELDELEKALRRLKERLIEMQPAPAEA
jgi:DNA-binding MarR family transcriptional regulator